MSTDADKLLKAVALLIEQQKLKTESEPKSLSNIKFDPFSEKEETLNNFVNRFENWMSLQNEDLSRKVPLFLNYIGPKLF